ncbi:hypothetical protein ENBRE01_3122 [Enteropsectra breve]|nr:hypothetical protein ENBRE01_3122 [Enteropsectra breve]
MHAITSEALTIFHWRLHQHSCLTFLAEGRKTGYAAKSNSLFKYYINSTSLLIAAQTAQTWRPNKKAILMRYNELANTNVISKNEQIIICELFDPEFAEYTENMAADSGIMGLSALNLLRRYII